jgi:hypothetical protein
MVTTTKIAGSHELMPNSMLRMRYATSMAATMPAATPGTIKRTPGLWDKKDGTCGRLHLFLAG